MGLILGGSEQLTSRTISAIVATLISSTIQIQRSLSQRRQLGGGGGGGGGIFADDTSSKDLS